MRTDEERRKWKKKKKKKKKKKRRRKMGALHHFSASAVAREGSCEGARGCLLIVRITVQKRDHFAGVTWVHPGTALRACRKSNCTIQKDMNFAGLRSGNSDYSGG